MHLGLRAAVVALAALFGGAAVGCSGADEHPLGGAYGGTANVPYPTQGSSTVSSSDGGTSDGGGSGGAHDSGTGASQDSGGSSVGNATAPTWTAIFNSYLAVGKVGNCGQCHGQLSSPKASYSWFQSQGYIGGSSPPLTDPSQSCLSWYGGNMPPGGQSDSRAVADMDSWAKAGAKND